MVSKIQQFKEEQKNFLFLGSLPYVSMVPRPRDSRTTEAAYGLDRVFVWIHLCSFVIYIITVYREK